MGRKISRIFHLGKPYIDVMVTRTHSKIRPPSVRLFSPTRCTDLMQISSLCFSFLIFKMG